MIFWKLASVTIFISTIYANPFLYNPNKAFSLVVASTEQPSSNIADLRVPKIEQTSKLEENQDENKSFFDDVANEPIPNRVIPGLVQKKIAKIFAKLQILSSLSNNNNYDEFNNNTDTNQNVTLFNGGEIETFSVTTNNSILSEGNYSAEQFEKLRNAEEVTRPLNFMPITLSRIFESIVNFAYRTFASIPAKAITDPESHRD